MPWSQNWFFWMESTVAQVSCVEVLFAGKTICNCRLYAFYSISTCSGPIPVQLRFCAWALAVHARQHKATAVLESQRAGLEWENKSVYFLVFNLFVNYMFLPDVRLARKEASQDRKDRAWPLWCFVSWAGGWSYGPQLKGTKPCWCLGVVQEGMYGYIFIAQYPHKFGRGHSLLPKYWALLKIFISLGRIQRAHCAQDSEVNFLYRTVSQGLPLSQTFCK